LFGGGIEHLFNATPRCCATTHSAGFTTRGNHTPFEAVGLEAVRLWDIGDLLGLGRRGMAYMKSILVLVRVVN
jgi:hypothetical protein